MKLLTLLVLTYLTFVNSASKNVYTEFTLTDNTCQNDNVFTVDKCSIYCGDEETYTQVKYDFNNNQYVAKFYGDNQCATALVNSYSFNCNSTSTINGIPVTCSNLTPIVKYDHYTFSYSKCSDSKDFDIDTCVQLCTGYYGEVVSNYENVNGYTAIISQETNCGISNGGSAIPFMCSDKQVKVSDDLYVTCFESNDHSASSTSSSSIIRFSGILLFISYLLNLLL